MAKKKVPVPLREHTSDKELELIGDRIKSLRRARGFTSAEKFANTYEISRIQWGKYERGYNMNTATLIKICKVFEITLPEFFAEGFD